MMSKFRKLWRYVREYDVVKSLYWYWRLCLPRVAALHIYPHSIVQIAKNGVLDIRQGEMSVNKSWFEGRDRRYKSALRIMGGGKIIIEGDFHLFDGASVFVGPGATLLVHGGWSFLNTNATLNCHERIEIGRGCAISDNVCIADSDSHIIDNNEAGMTAPIVIEDHVWIAKNVTVLKGVTIGEGAIIGAGSVVTKSIPAHCLAVGNPARVIREEVKWR